MEEQECLYTSKLRQGSKPAPVLFFFSQASAIIIIAIIYNETGTTMQEFFVVVAPAISSFIETKHVIIFYNE